MMTSTQSGELNDDPLSQWSDISPRLARITATLGAEAGRRGLRAPLQLEPVLSNAEVREIETQIGIRLPDEYRSFLLQAGNGGAGPHYGLCPLRKTGGLWEMDGDLAAVNDMNRLSSPFLHTEAFHPSDFLPALPKAEDFETVHDYHRAIEEWEQSRCRFIEEQTSGLLYFCDIGCALRVALVVAGRARGQMRKDFTADHAGILPLFDDDGTPITFAAWYRGWLDDMEITLSSPRN
jgi:hypothetical protein